jgi:hypothetical protein
MWVIGTDLSRPADSRADRSMEADLSRPEDVLGLLASLVESEKRLDPDPRLPRQPVDESLGLRRCSYRP